MKFSSSLVPSLAAFTALCLQAATGLAADGGANDAAVAVDSGRADSGAPRVDAGGRADGGGHLDGGGDGSLPPPAFIIGKACKKTADCAAGLTCLLPTGSDLGPGGPAGGICTLDCAANGDADCIAVDTAGICVQFTPTKVYCLEQCIPGAPIQGLVKCHSRPDMACTPTQDLLAAYCAPTCRGDYDCGTRKCDPDTGLCVDKIVGTLDTGAACDPGAATIDCKGGCLSLGGTGAASDTTNSLCTSRCTLGAPNSCGDAPGSTGKVAAACRIGHSTEGVGDVGYCEQLCDCDSDCSNKDFACQPFAASDPSGRVGGCVPAAIATAKTPCGGGDAGKGGPGTVKGTGGAPGKSADAGAGGGAAKSGDSGGCGCHVEGGQPGGRSGTLAFAALGMVALLRRRRSGR